MAEPAWQDRPLDSVYRADGAFSTSHAKRNDSEKAWEGLTDATGFFTAGIYGAGPASLALGSYTLEYELLGVSCFIWPDGQTDMDLKITWIEEVYVPH